MISDVKYAWQRIYWIYEHYSYDQIAEAVGVNKSAIRIFWYDFKDGRRHTMKTIERYGKFFNMSIGDMLVNPEVDTEWYRDSDLKYLAKNIRRARENEGWTINMVNCKLMLKNNAFASYENKNVMPGAELLQSFANLLNMEIADLFLPPAEELDEEETYR